MFWDRPGSALHHTSRVAATLAPETTLSGTDVLDYQASLPPHACSAFEGVCVCTPSNKKRVRGAEEKCIPYSSDLRKVHVIADDLQYLLRYCMYPAII